ncbi:carbon-nitrogen hydrolase family protein [Thiomonas arsenitoxydans]|jgi:nitrilase|uniref:carbon-nitrogen hydrolase family protein n=1 Tax=Thiomonas arsenitoxydans (strain DSM 22701 / CIP 110005 / 3As) TaxID=426114 RepID=UPI001AC1EED7|nr:carbon-nitrogen hydrolase family protein [Thiomonas arsenitoxydans]MBN8776062.1 carbon-nitrogen hydrolase family protein [Thiomonas arsenitoxydans]
MKIAALQMVSGTSVAANLQRAQSLLEQAAAQGARLAVLPEYFCLMGQTDVDKVRVREKPGSGPIQDFLASTARRLGLWVVGGTLPLESPDPKRVLNSTLVFNPAGELAARYDKMHLFAFQRGTERYAEADSITPGAQPVAFDCEGWRMGLAICYDLRFPELFRALSEASACDAYLLPAAFTHTTGEKHWEVLLRARAIENLAYVVGCAQGGVHQNGRRTWGHSMVIDPWGDVLAMQAEGEAVVTATLDRDRMARHRESLPALGHRVV